MKEVNDRSMATEATVQTTRTDTLLSVQDLQTWFTLRKWGFLYAGDVRAVDGVSFELARGECVSIVGESGCGKSTLAKTILGLHPPTSGDIVFDGHRLSQLDREGLQWYRSNVSFVQQDPYGALPPFMNVRQILTEPLIINGIRNRGEQAQRIEEVMEEVRLLPAEDFLPKFPHMLSGGQQQRLVIARAMILRPRLILADEPVSMLDASVRVEILELLRRLQAEHELGLIYITHDLSTVRHFSERVFVMYGGKIVEKAGVNELIDDPKHPYTQALLQAIPDADAANAEVMREIPAGEPPSLVHPPPGCRFHPRCPKFIEGLCETEEPPEFEPELEHYTECWLYR